MPARLSLTVGSHPLGASWTRSDAYRHQERGQRSKGELSHTAQRSGRRLGESQVVLELSGWIAHRSIELPVDWARGA